MASKELSEFEKGQIGTFKDYWLLVAKKLNHNHSSIDVILKNVKKTGNYH